MDAERRQREPFYLRPVWRRTIPFVVGALILLFLALLASRYWRF